MLSLNVVQDSLIDASATVTQMGLRVSHKTPLVLGQLSHSVSLPVDARVTQQFGKTNS